MDIKEIKKNARERMKEFCNLCKECNGVWCAGKVPGMGGTGTGINFKNTYEKLKDIKIIMKTIHDVKDPSLEIKLFNRNLSFPALIAPITGTKFNMGGYVSDEEYSNDVVGGAISAGTIAMIGDSGNPKCFEYGIKAIKKFNGEGIAIIKPRENDEIVKRIKIAEKANAIAVGIDSDGAGLITMKFFGQPVGPKSLEDLKKLVSSTKLPFIVKGILSVEEALLCVEAGVHTIIVSNHGGRVLNGTIAPCEILRDIVDAVGHKINVLVDGSVREGEDILKYLALGAKAVLVGRPIIWGSVGGREEGVKITLENLKSELYKALILTGNNNAKMINPKTIF